MTEKEAIQHLRDMMWGVQRARSIMMEQFGDFESLLEELNPWLFGKGCVLPALSERITKIDAGTPLQPSEFYNLMIVAQRSPAIDAALFSTRQATLPEPDPQWLRGWSVNPD